MSLQAKLSVIQQVSEYLKAHIQDGSWPVGSKIPSENTLAHILGASRASIRVAIQQFVGVGVLESWQGKGTFVKRDILDVFPSKDSVLAQKTYMDIEKVLEFRSFLEPEGCRIAARNPTPELIQALERHLRNMMDNIGNRKVFVEQDILFHKCIAQGSGNMLLEKSLSEVFNATFLFHLQMNEIFGYQDGIYYHSIILNAIRNKKTKLARKLMDEHIQQAIAHLKAQ
ncbi:FadR/GntR family transcriptional regulator [Fretibacterium sp. OH1220_COT-178]|uniref:FadR/GntR family transcriptional regulator n=1 Tax=Fretibacterium sp. OH1220_COT-178 TaxID=2491047 RepID=UPI000F5D90CC|nr:FCD domain-containing protein [Fretibacterium sp. OH1220_COT-178]RRD64287.1 FadR family transcriptional regulator [Fretibacterium sp. OH1220_COT-178]